MLRFVIICALIAVVASQECTDRGQNCAQRLQNNANFCTSIRRLGCIASCNQCADRSTRCQRRINNNPTFCTQRIECRRTCGLCEGEGCTDNTRANCEQRLQRNPNFCTSVIRTGCLQSCGQCADRNPRRCQRIIANNPTFCTERIGCRRTCGLCDSGEGENNVVPSGNFYNIISAKDPSMGIKLMLFGKLGWITSTWPLYSISLLDECLQAHNERRFLHSSPRMTWDPAVAQKAQEWADHLSGLSPPPQISHSTAAFREQNGVPVGENIFWSSNQNLENACTVATTNWYNEVAFYDYNNPGFSGATGHFTQVVWRASTKLGVGIARGVNGVFVVAQYAPAGNFLGQFQQNVLPPNIPA